MFVYILAKQCRSPFNLANFFDKIFRNSNFNFWLQFLTIGAFAFFVTIACVDVGQGFLSLLFLIPMMTIFYLCWFVVQSVYLDTKEGKINGTNTFRVWKMMVSLLKFKSIKKWNQLRFY